MYVWYYACIYNFSTGILNRMIGFCKHKTNYKWARYTKKPTKTPLYKTNNMHRKTIPVFGCCKEIYICILYCEVLLSSDHLQQQSHVIQELNSELQHEKIEKQRLLSSRYVWHYTLLSSHIKQASFKRRSNMLSF